MNERWVTIFLGGGILALVVFLAVKGGGGSRSTLAAAGDAGADAISLISAASSVGPGDLAGVDAGEFSFGVLGAGSGGGHDDRADSGSVGTRLPDGKSVPPLPDKAPRSVRFGVVLVTYAGADQAPKTARTKKDAEELALKLAADAKTDFHAAVGHGDSGSSDDLGRMPRGALELGVEYALFTLVPGQVSEPVDTPRGFWIMKRLD